MPTADHPFFWAGYLLVDTGPRPADAQEPPKVDANAAAAKGKEVPPPAKPGDAGTKSPSVEPAKPEDAAAKPAEGGAKPDETDRDATAEESQPIDKDEVGLAPTKLPATTVRRGPAPRNENGGDEPRRSLDVVFAVAGVAAIWRLLRRPPQAGQQQVADRRQLARQPVEELEEQLVVRGDFLHPFVAVGRHHVVELLLR